MRRKETNSGRSAAAAVVREENSACPGTGIDRDTSSSTRPLNLATKLASISALGRPLASKPRSLPTRATLGGNVLSSGPSSLGITIARLIDCFCSRAVAVRMLSSVL